MSVVEARLTVVGEIVHVIEEVLGRDTIGREKGDIGGIKKIGGGCAALGDAGGGAFMDGTEGGGEGVVEHGEEELRR